MKKKQQPKPKQSISPTTVWLAAIASTLVLILLYMGFFWLDNQVQPNTAPDTSSFESELGKNELIIIGLIVSAFVLGPGILVALIVLPIIRKNNKK
jgi:hypothetical protein